MPETECPLKSAEDVLAYYQMRLRVPKDQRNDYGKYNYRNMEGINDAFKRIQTEIYDKWGMLTSLHFTDDMLLSGPDVGQPTRYVQAELHTPFGDVSTSVSVQEPDRQGGMSPSQISGSASSYARKYAACDLFAIGGEKDPDELPPMHQTVYPDGKFDAKCRRCGMPVTGLTAQVAAEWKCPTCGAVDWEPVG